jgi:lysophospholipase L1-like esterase
VAHPIPSSIFSFDMKRVFNKLASWSLLVACFLGTVELACRIEQWFLYDAPVLGMYTYDTALFTMDEYGIRGKPNGAYEKWRLNSFGFRGPEIRRDKSSHRMRVVCVGASETFGLYESPGAEWPRQLESLLGNAEVESEVVNAAIAGMSLFQRTLHIQYRLIPFEPDVVLFMLEYGSYAGMTEQRLKGRQDKSVGLPSRTDIIASLKALRTVSRLKDVFLPRLPIQIQKGFEQLERGAKLRLKENELGPKFRSIAHVAPFEVDVFRRDLERLYAVSSAAGVRLVLLSPAMWFTERNFDMTYLSWPYLDESWWKEAQSVLSATARNFANERHLPYIDLSEAVRGHESEWMMDMLHFNDSGAKQVALRVADQVMKNGRLNVQD